MIVGIGVDVADISRFESMISRRPGLAERLLTQREREVSIQSQAGRFAAKEALAKALGSPGGLSWLDAEVVPTEHGQPTFVMQNTVQTLADSLGVNRVHLSLSHDAGVVVAMVVCES